MRPIISHAFCCFLSKILHDVVLEEGRALEGVLLRRDYVMQSCHVISCVIPSPPTFVIPHALDPLIIAESDPDLMSKRRRAKVCTEHALGPELLELLVLDPAGRHFCCLPIPTCCQNIHPSLAHSKSPFPAGNLARSLQHRPSSGKAVVQKNSAGLESRFRKNSWWRVSIVSHAALICLRADLSAVDRRSFAPSSR
jgi:hypothetical protein